METPPKADANEGRARLAHGFLKARGFDDAIKIAETLDLAGRATVLSQVARQKQRDGDRNAAAALFRRALVDAGQYLHSPRPVQIQEEPGQVPVEDEGGPGKREALDPTVTHQTKGLCLLAVIHARAGDWASAARTLAVISSEDQQQRVAASQIASLRSRSGDVAGALTWARSLPVLLAPRLGLARPGRGDLRRGMG